jgi:hypothetical protein
MAGPSFTSGTQMMRPLGALRAEIVDRGERLLAILGADLHQGEALFLGRLVGEFPFVLEPGLFRLLDHEADLDIGRHDRRGQRRQHDPGGEQVLEHTHSRSPPHRWTPAGPARRRGIDRAARVPTRVSAATVWR